MQIPPDCHGAEDVLCNVVGIHCNSLFCLVDPSTRAVA